jgi:glutamate-1-semialdehyde 2,1-aminomutase
MPTISNTSILAAYLEKTAQSRALFERAQGLFPNGVTHVGRFLDPYPVYISRAAGPHKWDVDGNRYVDYFGGHGALLLGHVHPLVTEAVERQLALGAHYGASHELEIEWASLVQEMVPSAERVRFTVSGTEATLLGLRLARAITGRNQIVRFGGHFHGWHDHVSFLAGGAPGIVPGIADETIILPPNEIDRVREALGTGNVAAVIIEPTGATFGHVPTPPEFLRALREATSETNTILIFDEVISGFRCSPGGAQAYYGVVPDLTSLAKILAGGFPGAALAGRADILALLEFRHEAGGVEPPRVTHQGTYNAGPVSAAAGIATLRLIRDTDAIEVANKAAAAIRDGMNECIRRKSIPWCAYGRFSDFHIYADPEQNPTSVDDIYAGRVAPSKLKGGMKTGLMHKIRTGMLVHGVDVTGWPGGLVSSTHTGDDVERTVSAFQAVIDALGEEGDLP